MRRTRTCATSLIPPGRHGSARVGARRFDPCRGCDARDGRDGRTRGRADGDRGCATVFTFVAAAGRACFCTVAGGGFSAAGCTEEPPAQPAARTGTKIQLAARAVTNGYPVNFGSPFVGFAAGAVPPPPPPPLSVVDVVPVDVEPVVEPVVEPAVEVSGVVVAIVVTTVVLPVVIVVTIVVVASARNGAAPAVNAAVAAPSVISTANAAPQMAYFLYCLLIPPPLVPGPAKEGLPTRQIGIPPRVSARILGRDERLDRRGHRRRLPLPREPGVGHPWQARGDQ